MNVDESTYAVAKAVARFVAPGPTDVVTAAGTRLLALKYPSAMWPPHCSCLTWTTFISGARSRAASKIETFPCPGIPKMYFTPALRRDSTTYWAPVL